MHMLPLLFEACSGLDLFPLDDPAFERLPVWQRMGQWHKKTCPSRSRRASGATGCVRWVCTCGVSVVWRGV